MPVGIVCSVQMDVEAVEAVGTMEGDKFTEIELRWSFCSKLKCGAIKIAWFLFIKSRINAGLNCLSCLRKRRSSFHL